MRAFIHCTEDFSDNPEIPEIPDPRSSSSSSSSSSCLSSGCGTVGDGGLWVAATPIWEFGFWYFGISVGVFPGIFFRNQHDYVK